MVQNVSTFGLRLVNTNNLLSGQYTMGILSQQLATGKKATDLKEYSTSEAQQLMNFTNSITMRQSFLSTSQSLTPRIKVYDDSLTGIENIAATANSTTMISSTYNEEQNATLSRQITGYLQQVNYYLNQKVGDRYIFAGSRYNTAPVKDLTTLPLMKSYKPASVDVQSNCLNITSKYSGTFGNGTSVQLDIGTAPNTYKATIHMDGQADEVFDNVGGTGSTFWDNLKTAINAGSRLVTATVGGGYADPVLTSNLLTGGTGDSTNGAATVTVPSNPITFTALNSGTFGNNITVKIDNCNPAILDNYQVTVSIPGKEPEIYTPVDGSGGDAAFWTNLTDAINGTTLPPSTPSSIIMATAGTGTASPVAGTTYNLSGGATSEEQPPYTAAANVLPTYDADYDASYDPESGLQSPNANRTDAYHRDQVSIDTAQNLSYGISSDETGFQQLIMGLRFAYSATQDPTNYASNMAKAKDLINTGLASIRGIHSNLSSANTTLEQAKLMHENFVSTLKGQISDIQSVDINEVALKINTYQASLQAAYAATATITKISILNYL